MAFSLTATGVDVSRGRGAARVVLSLSFKDLEKWARRQEIDTARLMQRSFGRAASGLKKKFYDVMKSGGGVCGVPKFKDFDAFTAELRRVTGRSSPMGGILADKGNIVAFKRNGYQVIGWPDNLEKVATAFQEGRGGSEAERWFTDPSYRRLFHKDGVRHVPQAYVHNPRMVIPEPFGSYVQQNLEEWARGAFYKELARQMMKGSK